jgi:hypothetical protein
MLAVVRHHLKKPYAEHCEYQHSITGNGTAGHELHSSFSLENRVSFFR